jgi:hypothetical protein
LAYLIRETHEGTPAQYRRGWWILGCVACVGLIAFLLAPGSTGLKAHMALHGICAQRPSHSFWLGSGVLPLDARMTGIDLASATTLAWLAARCRLRAARVPGRTVLATLTLFILLMGFDGTNGLLSDLGLWHLYVPANLTRLLSGILAGTALGVAIGHLFAISMWARPQTHKAVVETVSELLPPMLIACLIGSVALMGLPIAYDPFAVGLVFVAIAVFWMPSMAVIALVTRKSWQGVRFADLDWLALAGLVSAIGVLAGLSALRVFAEQALGLPRLT